MFPGLNFLGLTQHDALSVDVGSIPRILPAGQAACAAFYAVCVDAGDERAKAHMRGYCGVLTNGTPLGCQCASYCFIVNYSEL